MRTRNTPTSKKAGATPPAKKGSKTPVKSEAQDSPVHAEAVTPEPILVKSETASAVVETVETVETKVESISVIEIEDEVNGEVKDSDSPAVEKPKEPAKKTPKKKGTPKKEVASAVSEIESKEAVKPVTAKESELVKSDALKPDEVKVEEAKSDLPTQMEVEEVVEDEEMEQNDEEDEGVELGDEEEQEGEEDEEAEGEEELEGEEEEVAEGEEGIENDEGIEDEGEEEELDEEEEEEEEGGEDDEVGDEAEEHPGLHEAPPVTERQKRKKLEIFVGGLDKEATEEDLRKVFEQAGEVVEVRLMMNPHTAKNKGYAFIRFANSDQAKRAINELSRPQVRGKSCGVSPSEDNDILFLGNINKSWKSEQVLEKLKDYGVEGIEEMTLMEDPQNEGMNRGFAFLELATHNEAIQAYKRLQMPDAIFGSDRSAKIAWAQPFNEPDEEMMARVKSVFVDGLPADWTDDKVKEHFAKYGEIERIVMARNMSSARRKDFGFVNYVAREGAVACVEAFKSTEHITDGEDKIKVKVELSKPQPRSKSKKGGVRGGYPLGRGGRGRGAGFARGGRFIPRKPGRGGRGLARGASRGAGRGGRGGKRLYDEPNSHHLMRALRQRAAEERPPPIERSRGRRPAGSGPSRPPRGPGRGGYPRHVDVHYSRGSHSSRAGGDYGARRLTPPRRAAFRDDYPPPRGARLSPSGPRSRSSHPSRYPLHPPHDDGYPRRVERGHGYGRDSGGYGSAARDYSEAGPGMKRAFSAMDDDPSYFEPAPRGYTRARVDYADPVALGGPGSQYADPIRAPPLGRPSHGLGVGGGRAALPPLASQSSLSIYDSGSGLGGGTGSLYGSGYGSVLSGAGDYAAEMRGPSLHSSSLYGGRSSSGGYNLPGGSGSYY